MSEAMPTREPSLQPQAPKFLTRIPVVGEDLAREWPQIRAIRYTIVLVVVATVLLTGTAMFIYMQWHYSAQLSFDQQVQDYLKRQIDDLHRTDASKPIPGAPGPVEPPRPAPTKLADQSNSQLRENAEKFAIQLTDGRAATGPATPSSELVAIVRQKSAYLL
jgi:hypothetical protein